MFLEYDDFDTFIKDVLTQKTKRWYHIIELKDYTVIEAYAQSVKNTYYIKIETSNPDQYINTLNKEDFSLVKSIKTWEG